MGDLHVFLSYCRENKPQVQMLRDDLVSQGFVVWWDDDLVPGQNWKTELRKAVQASGAVVACFSEEVQKRDSSGMFPELRDAIECHRQLRPGSIYLVPVRLSACSVPDLDIDATTTLPDIQYVDLFPVDSRQNGLEKLVDALSLCPRLKRTRVKPSVPRRTEHVIAQRTFRVGEGIDPIDDATTVIVFKGTNEKVQSAKASLESSFGALVSSAYDHGEDIHEVMVRAPVGSAQISILAHQI